MKKYFFYIIIFLCYSCEKVIDINTDYSDERLVIDATVFKKLNEKFATAIVRVSTTDPFFSKNNTEINNAEVIIKTQKGNVNLNYDTEKKYYSNTIDFSDFKEDYEISIDYNGQSYFSSEKLIKIPPIESVTFGNRKSLNSDEIELLVTFTDPKGVGDYYLWKFGPFGIDNKYDYLVSRDLYIDGNQLTFSFFIDKTKYFNYDEYVNIEISGLTDEGYNYLNILTAQAGAQNGRPFSTASSVIKGNIINQTNPNKYPLGYFRVSEFDYFRLSKEDAPVGFFD